MSEISWHVADKILEDLEEHREGFVEDLYEDYTDYVLILGDVKTGVRTMEEVKPVLDTIKESILKRHSSMTAIVQRMIDTIDNGTEPAPPGYCSAYGDEGTTEDNTPSPGRRALSPRAQQALASNAKPTLFAPLPPVSFLGKKK